MERHETISPYGGILINRFIEDPLERKEIEREANALEKVFLSTQEIGDLELITFGGLSPLEGFMDSRTYLSVLEKMCLPGGLPWTIPITLCLSSGQERKVKAGDRVSLARYNDREIIGIMEVEDIYKPDVREESVKVFGTDDTSHPGVKRVIENEGKYYIGGKVKVFKRPCEVDFPQYHRDPLEVRKIFTERGWKTVVAFQTRNPIHRAHEYLQKCALEMVDGLLIHPIVGETKSDDISAKVRMRCYEVLMENYFPKERVLLSVLPMAMRYAGPMEAIHHCIVRRNYGATHFIIGRDHAGVGNYYGSFDAHRIFEKFDLNKLGITPIFFDHAFYCKKCSSMATQKTCPHPQDMRITLSGTKVREMLMAGIEPPPEFTRKEVASILMEEYKGKDK